MATQRAKTEDLLYLDKITLQDAPSLEYKLGLFIESQSRELRTTDDQTWTPAQRLNVFWASDMRVEIQMESGEKTQEKSEVINLQGLFNEYWRSKGREFTVPKVVVVGKHRWSLELRFSASATTESVRSWLGELEGKYSSPMKKLTETTLENGSKSEVAFSELNPMSRVVFSVASVTSELLKEECKKEQRLLGLCDQLQRIVRLADKVTSKVMCQETDFLEKTIPRMFEVVQRTARFSCDYVKRANMADGLLCLETTEEMENELTKVIDDLDREMNRTALSVTRRNEMYFLGKRLEAVNSDYDPNLGCMEGTRESLLNQIMVWVTNNNKTNTYWIYGVPGMGKTSLAHSICATLDDGDHLAGAFFCRRDDPNLGELRNILPVLIYTLASTFPPFRTTVAEHLRNNADLTLESMKGTLILDFIRSLPRHPDRTLVFVIDALDECGNPQSRRNILKVLTDAAIQAPWLKVIITSRPEVDIERFFNTATQSSHLRYDLATCQEASADLRNFAQSQLDLMASNRHLTTPWPEASLIDQAISRANGLFIFIKTVVRALENCGDLTEYLEAVLRDSDISGLTSLYGLYYNILEAKAMPGDPVFQRVIGVLLATAQFRPLDEETIGELAGVEPNLIEKWVDDLSSLLSRDTWANGEIRVRHLSIFDFFVSDDCHHDYQVNLVEANMHLGIACLKTMIAQLHFNICKLEDSRLANADHSSFPFYIRPKEISDPLWYSAQYWSNHLCFAPDVGDERTWVSLKEFFEGPYPLYWIEVLSIMGMVPIAAQSLRRVISWVKDADSFILEMIQDVYHFITTFDTPISLSAPHIYISTRPFLPSESPLSTIFSKVFTGAIKMRTGKVLSWPALLSEQTGHTHAVNCVSYSPDGCYIATGSDDKTIRIWDAKTGTVVGMPLKGHTRSVRSIAYSPDGQHVISASDDKTIRIWGAKTGAAIGKPLKGHTHYVRSVACSPDGQYIISGSDDKTIRIWDVKADTAVGTLLEGHTDYVRSVACSPDGHYIVSGSDDKTIRIWDVKTGASILLEGHTDYVRSVAFSPDGRNIISGSDDKTIRVWDAKTGAVVGIPLEGHTAEVLSVAYSTNGQYIISGSGDRTIRIWDAKAGTAVGMPLNGHSDIVRAVAHSPNKDLVVSGSSDNTARVWDLFPHASIQPPSSDNLMHAHAQFCAQPDPEGWVKDSMGGLLYWVPPYCRTGLHSPALLTMPLTSQRQSVSLDFEEFVFGTSWTQIFNSPQS